MEDRILVSLQIYDAKNVICAWNEENDEIHPTSGIMSRDAERDYLVPKLIAVGVFDDGSVQAAGLQKWDDINTDDYGDLFCFKYIIEYVDYYYARAFVRYVVSHEDCMTESEARKRIYKDLLDSGVKIEKDADYYLQNGDIQVN